MNARSDISYSCNLRSYFFSDDDPPYTHESTAVCMQKLTHTCALAVSASKQRRCQKLEEELFSLFFFYKRQDSTMENRIYGGTSLMG